MSLAEQYRQHADECIRLAGSAGDPVDRALLLQMAQAWRRLADRAEAENTKKRED
jgi:hypothetical protein